MHCEKCFLQHNPFLLISGKADDINCHFTNEVGYQIQQTLYHMKFNEIKVKRRNKFFMLVTHYSRSMLEKVLWLSSAFFSNLTFTAQKMKFSFKDLVTFTEEILNGKRHFLCSVICTKWRESFEMFNVQISSRFNVSI